MSDTLGVLTPLAVGDRSVVIAALDALGPTFDVGRLPYTLRILLENVLRADALGLGSADEVRAVAAWDPTAEPTDEISFRPSRVLLQDFTGVPSIVDLAAMRDTMRALGGDPARINPVLPAELVIDHSVQVDEFGTRSAMRRNTELEFQRNGERYAFLRWGQRAFRNFKVVPPSTGIVHQVNLEYLARVVEARATDGQLLAVPDTLVGTDSHTTMVNGLGVLGWGVGIRAVIAESFERIHRSNLVGMGILPLQFRDGESQSSLRLTGREAFAINGLGSGEPRDATVTAVPDAGEPIPFAVRVRLETSREWEHLRHGGILQYALRQLLAG